MKAEKIFALCGNPNTGKTTLYNKLTCSSEHTGNWHGVTVDYKQCEVQIRNEKVIITDLPGLYSLNTVSYEEKVATDYIFNKNNINLIGVCDANNLSRNLYLIVQLLEKGIKSIIVINMVEDLLKRKMSIDVKKLSKLLNTKVILNTKKTSVEDLYKQIMTNDCENNANSKEIERLIEYSKTFDEIEMVQKRYEIIDEIMQQVLFTKDTKAYGESKLNNLLLNKYLTLPIFIFLMAVVFFITFGPIGKGLSSLFSRAIEKYLQNPLLNYMEANNSSQIMYSFVKNAIFGGLFSLISFLPQIVLLFLFLGLLEESGYLCRLSFTLDDIFEKIGLNGKSVFTLLMGFGCSAQACMTARNNDDKNSKIKTAMVTSYISCSAKIPIYIVICTAFFSQGDMLIITLMYLIGIALAILMIKIFNKGKLKSKEQSFILEFSQLRQVGFKKLFQIIRTNCNSFIIRVGTLILSFSVIVWFMQTFTFSLCIASESHPSILQKIGEFICVIFSPLGFGTYGVAAALICGVIAKELIVSTIGMINCSNNSSIGTISASLLLSSSVISFTPASALSFMIFSVLYFPCIANIGVMIKEIGRKWTLVACLTQFVNAYILAFFVYKNAQVFYSSGFLMGILSSIISIIILFSIYFIINLLAKKINYCTFCRKSCKQDCVGMQSVKKKLIINYKDN